MLQINSANSRHTTELNKLNSEINYTYNELNENNPSIF